MSHTKLEDLVLQTQNLEVAVGKLAEQEPTNDTALYSIYDKAAEHFFHAGKYLYQAIAEIKRQADINAEGDFVV